VPLRTNSAALAQADDGTILVAERGLHQNALGLRRCLRDDIDDAVDGVGPPQGGAGPADHLDAFDVWQHDIELLPVDPGEGRCVDRAAVDLYQELVGETFVEAAGADRPLVGVNARHLHAGDQAQQFGDRRRSGATDVNHA